MTAFSLSVGGPLYELYRRCGLVRPPTGLTHRRVLVAITWAPLAALSAVGGLMTSRVEVPFGLTIISVDEILDELVKLIL